MRFGIYLVERKCAKLHNVPDCEFGNVFFYLLHIRELRSSIIVSFKIISSMLRELFRFDNYYAYPNESE